MKKLGIIGQLGDVNNYIIQYFLDQNFQVKMSVDSVSQKDYSSVKKDFYLQHCILDITNIESVKRFIFDCDIIIYNDLNPFINTNNIPTELLLKPSSEIIKNVLEAISKTPTIEKLIFITSTKTSKQTNYNTPLKHTWCNLNDVILNTKNDLFTSSKFLANKTLSAFIDNTTDLAYEITKISLCDISNQSHSGKETNASTNLQVSQNSKQTLALIANIAHNATLNYGKHGENFLIYTQSSLVKKTQLPISYNN